MKRSEKQNLDSPTLKRIPDNRNKTQVNIGSEEYDTMTRPDTNVSNRPALFFRKSQTKFKSRKTSSWFFKKNASVTTLTQETENNDGTHGTPDSKSRGQCSGDWDWGDVDEDIQFAQPCNRGRKYLGRYPSGNGNDDQRKINVSRIPSQENNADGESVSTFVTTTQLNVENLPLDMKMEEMKELFPKAKWIRLQLVKDRKEQFRRIASVEFPSTLRARQVYKENKNRQIGNNKIRFDFSHVHLPVSGNGPMMGLNEEDIYDHRESPLPKECIDKASMIRDWVKVQSEYVSNKYGCGSMKKLEELY